MKTPILELSTDSATCPIKIDAKAYAIRHPNALSLFDFKHVDRQLPRVAHLLQQTAPSPEQRQELSQLLAEVTAIVLEAPDAVHAKLKDTHRLIIVEAFARHGGGRASARSTRPVVGGGDRRRRKKS